MGWSCGGDYARSECQFPVTAVRLFAGRSSTGVRGIRLKEGDEVIAMSVLHHIKVETEKRDLYLQAVSAARRLRGGDYTERAEDKIRDEELASRLEQKEFQTMAEEEEFILTVTDDGMGKRTSAYEYRISGRGGQGITGIELSRGKGQQSSSIVAAFTVLDTDQLVMVSDAGQIIRCPIDQISIIGRSGRGVSIFKVEDTERLVSVSRFRDLDDESEHDAAISSHPETDGEIGYPDQLSSEDSGASADENGD